VAAAAVRYELASRPLEISGCVVRNRIVRTSHTTGCADGGVTEEFIAFQEARARGGVGLSIMEYCAVHPSSPTELQGYDESITGGFARLTSRLHARGMKVFQQLWHGGAQGPGNKKPVRGAPARPGVNWSASAVPGPRGHVSIEMTRDQIAEIVAAYAAAAVRCRAGGMDGVEIHAGHGYLPCQFLSPLTNLRADEYGGGLEGRSRFLREVLAAVRAAAGPDYPLGVRLSATEAVPGGLEPSEVRAVAEDLTALGLVDFVDVSQGSHRSAAAMVGAMHEPHGYQVATSALVTQGLGVPTIVTGRITTLAEAEQVLASGAADLVSMVRAHIADPDLVAKSLAGREREVRPCIGCNEGCISGRRGSGMVACAVNPDVLGRPDAYPAADAPGRVMVVGAGPAGLEAARTARLCGHDVTVWEREALPGGRLRIAGLAPLRGEFARIIDWYADELHRLAVPVRYGAAVTPEIVADEDPDVVLVCTGARSRTDGIQRATARTVPGAGQSRVVSAEQALTMPAVSAGTPVLVFDDLGGYAGVGVAERFLALGCPVLHATGNPVLDADLAASSQWEPAMKRLHAHPGYASRTRSALVSLTASTATLAGLDTGAQDEVPAGLVVLLTAYQPEHALYGALGSARARAMLLGDAFLPSGLQAAVSGAYECASRLQVPARQSP
jgi:2,4-dienoyl-CoA reductase-like NADH-dependent reductase (Old Yellow Enzyme family)